MTTMVVSPERATHLACAQGVLPLMDEAEAKECVWRIRGGLKSIRAHLLNLHDRQGWKALGYGSFRACIAAEFEGSQPTLYRQLEEAQIEADVAPVVSQNEKPIPGSHLRELKALDADTRREAWQAAEEKAGGQRPTLEGLREAVAAVTPHTPALPALEVEIAQDNGKGAEVADALAASAPPADGQPNRYAYQAPAAAAVDSAAGQLHSVPVAPTAAAPSAMKPGPVLIGVPEDVEDALDTLLRERGEAWVRKLVAAYSARSCGAPEGETAADRIGFYMADGAYRTPGEVGAACGCSDANAQKVLKTLGAERRVREGGRGSRDYEYRVAQS